MSSATLTTWLVTGASRGIGLEIVRQLLNTPSNLVVAACRTPDKAADLHALQTSAHQGKLRIVPLDVANFDSIRALPAHLALILKDTGLDYLINNAGILEPDTAYTLDPEVTLRTLRTNVVGPALVSQVLLPLLEKGRAKNVLHISSTLGSIASATGFGPSATSYAISKAALNMMAYKQKLERPDLIVIPLCPGWVKTSMGGDGAQLEVQDSVAGILKVITSATPAQSGKYLRFDGEEIPW
ncbi:NAD-P-binding protein [Lenzites betulinus]|nr:NAD-P-binding protein [Lenzites betulinus]